jgi:antibiotic biosynthesis monooxygenase (ABM) superfamily enzyme
MMVKTEGLSEEPLTAIVHRRVKAGGEAKFEELMREFVVFVMQQPGHLGINVVRPAQGSRDYTVLDHFATSEDRVRFRSLPEYKLWMERLREVSEEDPEIEETRGLAFWFGDPNHPPRRPPKFKMALITLLGVYPLSMLFPKLVGPFTSAWPPWLKSLLIAALIVVGLTWAVMPALNKLFKKWLFKGVPGQG